MEVRPKSLRLSQEGRTTWLARSQVPGEWRVGMQVHTRDLQWSAGRGALMAGALPGSAGRGRAVATVPPSQQGGTARTVLLPRGGASQTVGEAPHEKGQPRPPPTVQSDPEDAETLMWMSGVSDAAKVVLGLALKDRGGCDSGPCHPEEGVAQHRGPTRLPPTGVAVPGRRRASGPETPLEGEAGAPGGGGRTGGRAVRGGQGRCEEALLCCQGPSGAGEGGTLHGGVAISGEAPSPQGVLQ